MQSKPESELAVSAPDASAADAPVPPPAPSSPPAKPDENAPQKPAKGAGALVGHGAPPAIAGQIDAVSGGVARGWAMIPSEPTTRLMIEIWEDSQFLAAGEASNFRSDVQKAGFGDGCSAFKIQLPRLSAGKHTLHAKVAGLNSRLPNEVEIDIPGWKLAGAIEKLEGLTLTSWFSGAEDDLITIEVFADGASIARIDFYGPIPHRNEFSVALPASLADGKVHWFQLKAVQGGGCFAEAVFLTSPVSTPEDALLRYANGFPGFLSSSAANRYGALERQIEAIASAEALNLPLERYVSQLVRAHEQVKRGIAEQNKIPGKFEFPVHEKPLVSVVVPLHNKFWVTYNCLAALLLAANKSTFEVILVDDGSSDMTKDLGKYVSGVTLLRNEVSLGFVKSSNRGATVARGKYVVMLNNDTEPCAGWIDELLYVFENFESVGLVGGKLVYPDGKLQEAGGIVFPNFDVWNYGRNGNQFDPAYNYTRQVDYVSGACIMLPKTLWDELGGFDEYFAPAYYEDNDLAFRVRSKGFKTFYAPFSKVVHFEGVSSGTSVTSGGAKRYQLINQPKFNARWASTIRNMPQTQDPLLARDRGIQLRALVIDAETPSPDRDAGSYAAIQEMRLLQALGLKLTFVPSNMAYLGSYTEHLQRQGVECIYAPYHLSVHEVIEQRGKEFDVFYITRYSVASNYIETIRQVAPNAKIIFNNADLHFLREIRAALAAKSPDALNRAVQTRDVELDVMRRVDVTLSYSDTEAAVILSHNLNSSKVAKCPWVVKVEEKIPPFAERAGLAFLGNFRHPPNEEAIRHFVADIMPALRREIPGLTLNIYGSNMPAELRKLEADGVVVKGFVEDVAEVYHSCRIFVAPLLSGAGIKGKVISALAFGAPIIMTSIAGEGTGVSRGVDAIVADSPAEWVAGVKKLYADEKAWTEMSRSAQLYARRNFSFEQGLKTMKDALALGGVYVS